MITNDRCLCHECKCRHCGWLSFETGHSAGRCSYGSKDDKESHEEGSELLLLDIDRILYSTPDALKIQLPDRTYFWVPKSITDSEHRIPRWFVEAKGLLPYLKSKLTYSQRKLEEFF